MGLLFDKDSQRQPLSRGLTGAKGHVRQVGKGTPGRKASKCKGPGVGTHVGCTGTTGGPCGCNRGGRHVGFDSERDGGF